MFTLKHFVVILVIQTAVSTHSVNSSKDIKPESIGEEEVVTDHPEPEKPKTPSDCIEKNYTLISYSDLKDLIDEKAENLQIQKHFVDKYYPGLKKVFVKYSNESEKFHQLIVDRPNHAVHILSDIAKLREKLQPVVDKIALQLQDFDDINQKFSDLKIRTNKTLKEFETIKSICLYCDKKAVEAIARFGHKTTQKLASVSKSAGNKNWYCVKLKDLNDKIVKTFIEKERTFNDEFNQELQNKDNVYAEKLQSYKEKLKKAVKKQFSTTMYDILSLQDEYHHYTKHLENDFFTEIHTIQENFADIDLGLIALKRDLEKYRQYCLTCNNYRMNHNTVHVLKDLNKIPRTNNFEIETILSNLIPAKIDEIVVVIKSNITNMFGELDKAFDDPGSIDSCLTKIKPIQTEIHEEIEVEKQALRQLRSRIPVDSKNKIRTLSEESKQIKEYLESVKQKIQKDINSR